MSSPARPSPYHPEDLAPLLRKLSDDLLADILIRLPTLADLGRACAACPTFRRFIGDHSFLRRVRALHPPVLLGFFSRIYLDFFPAQPPHPCAAVARTFADAADFSKSFLPTPASWRICDFLDGRTLLYRLSEKSFPNFLQKQFAICDLLHRRYILLPAIPANLTAVVGEQQLKKFEPFLAPHSGTDHEAGASFKVICLAECMHENKLFIFTFSSGDGQWHATEFDGWNALISAQVKISPVFRPSDSDLSGRDFAHGCFCWVMVKRHKLLLLDAHTMDFSSIDIPSIDKPPTVAGYWQAIVEASEGRFGMFTICVDRESSTYSLSYVVQQNDIQSLNSWKSQATIRLPLNYRFTILGITGGYLLLLGIPPDTLNTLIPTQDRPNMECFSLNLKTFLIEPFCSSKRFIRATMLYAGFPPSLSPPTI